MSGTTGLIFSHEVIWFLLHLGVKENEERTTLGRDTWLGGDMVRNWSSYPELKADALLHNAASPNPVCPCAEPGTSSKFNQEEGERQIIGKSTSGENCFLIEYWNKSLRQTTFFFLWLWPINFQHWLNKARLDNLYYSNKADSSNTCVTKFDWIARQPTIF